MLSLNRPQRTRRSRRRTNDSLRPAYRRLAFETMEQRTLLAAFTVNVLDQFGSEIAGSAVDVPGVGMVATGSAVTVADGDHTFRVVPKILDMGAFDSGGGRLYRTETHTITASTAALDFVWPVEQVQLNLVDQFGDPITGINGRPSVFHFNFSALDIDNGSTVALPITDESQLPGSLEGQFADGYDLRMYPAVLDTVFPLGRLETSSTTEVSTSTSDLTFVWATVSGPLRVVDENELGIGGSEYFFSNSGLILATGSHVVLPITDESQLPGSLEGQWANGYDVSIRLPGASAFAGPSDFELASDRTFSPLFVTIDEASVGLRFLPDAQPVEIDVKPGSDPNSINLASNGVIAVAIFTTVHFDASQVDVSSVNFAGAYAVQSALEDVDHDGDLDMVLHFRTQDTVLDEIYAQLVVDDIDADGVLDSNKQEFEVTLTGSTLDDQLFEGMDGLELFLAGKSLRNLLDELAATGEI